MFTIDTNTLNGTIVISDIFNIGASASDADATPYINSIGEEYTISFTNIQNIEVGVTDRQTHREFNGRGGSSLRLDNKGRGGIVAALG